MCVCGTIISCNVQNGLTALHIACKKGIVGVVRLIREKGEEQKRFCGLQLNSDYEVLINAKERLQVCV